MSHQISNLITRIFIIYLSLASIPALAQNPFNAPDTVINSESTKPSVSPMLIPSIDQAAPGSSFDLAIELTHPDGWYSYHKVPGGPGLPLEFVLSLPDGYLSSEILWPVPHQKESNGVTFNTHKGTAYFLTSITVPEDAKLGEKISIQLKVKAQLCQAEACMPPSTSATTATINIAAQTTQNQVNVGQITSVKSQLPSNQSKSDTESKTDIIPEITPDAPSPAADLTAVPDTKVVTIPLSRLDDEGWVLDDQEKRIQPQDLLVDTDGNLVDKDGNILGKKKELTFLLAIVLIVIGGLILNLMPCVFPVLGVKVLGFVQLSGNDPAKIKKHGLVFTLGVIVSMWILAGAILAFKFIAGDDVAWGQQMQSPIFVGIMIIFLFLFALNLYGVFEVGTSLTSVGGDLQQKKGYSGSFFSGVLTTLIATPCGAPLLAPAMTYTLQQNSLVAMILFTFFGLGVALPYLLLSFFPKLIDKLPHPGNWMVTFKKSMAFPMLATVAFLFMVFMKLTGEAGAILMVWALVIFATAAFFYGTWSSPFISKFKRYFAGFFIAGALAAWAGYLTYHSVNSKRTDQPLGNHEWIQWKPNLVEQTRSKNRIVWIDYTADW